ncbi:MAG: EamA family transporter [archaeon]
MIRWYIFGMVLIATIAGAFGALYLKRSAKSMKGSLISKIFEKNLIIGLFLYGVGSLFSLVALKFENVSIVYALTSMSYIWIALLSRKFLGEKINRFKWFGISLIILGVVLMSI